MKRVRIAADTSVDFKESDKIINEVATRKRSIDFLSAMHYLPNPDPVLKRQGKDIKVYSDLLYDPSVSAAVGSWKDGVQELEWDIDRGRSKSRQAKLIRQIFDSIDGLDKKGGLYRIFGEILNARLYGYQPCEIRWEKSGNMIVPVDIVAKPQHWFTFSDEGKLLFRSSDSMMGEAVPDYKFIVPTYDGSYNNPYGTAVLAKVFWPVTFKKGGMKFFVTFCEKYGMPYIIGKHKFTTDDEVTQFISDLDDMVADGVIAIGMDSQEITVVPTGTSASSDIYTSLVSVMDEQISRAILHHTAATSSTPGKLGNETGALDARGSVINAGKRLVSQAMNTIIKWTYELNGMTGEVPKFIFFEEDQVDMATAERDEKLTAQGVKFTKSYYVKAYGLDEEDFELGPPAPAAPPASFAEDTRTEDQIVTDDLIELLSKGQMVKEVGDELIQPVLDFIDGAGGYEEAMSGLLDLYPKMKVATLQKLLTNAQATAFLMGHTHAEE